MNKKTNTIKICKRIIHIGEDSYNISSISSIKIYKAEKIASIIIKKHPAFSFIATILSIIIIIKMKSLCILVIISIIIICHFIEKYELRMTFNSGDSLSIYSYIDKKFLIKVAITLLNSINTEEEIDITINSLHKEILNINNVSNSVIATGDVKDDIHNSIG